MLGIDALAPPGATEIHAQAIGLPLQRRQHVIPGDRHAVLGDVERRGQAADVAGHEGIGLDRRLGGVRGHLDEHGRSREDGGESERTEQNICPGTGHRSTSSGCGGGSGSG